MVTIAAIFEFAGNVLTICNKCCKTEAKDKKDADGDEDTENDLDAKSDAESEPSLDENTKKSTNKPKKTRKKRSTQYTAMKQIEPTTVQPQPATVQNHFNPTFTIINQPYAPAAQPLNLPGIQTGHGTSGTPAVEQSVMWEWVATTISKCSELIDKAIIGGHDIDGSDLWIIRARFKGGVIPGKFNYIHSMAFLAVDNVEKTSDVFEVCCIAPEYKSRIKWIEGRDGRMPNNAIAGGRTSDGETLYIGKHLQIDETGQNKNSICPGYIQPSHGLLYITYGFKVYSYKTYDVMCFE